MTARRGALVVVLLLALAACRPAGAAPDGSTGSGTPSSSPAAEGGTMRWAVSSPIAITPHAVVDSAGMLVVDSLFDSLTALTTAGEVLPSAATRWEVADGGRRWRFTLRPGATYHDGTPVRADDVARAWARTVADGRTGPHLADVVGYDTVRRRGSGRLAGARAIDDATLEVVLSTPDMSFPATVAHPSLAPLPPAAFEDEAGFALEPVGNGPYRMAEPWVPGQFIRVQRADEWNNGPAERSSERIRELLFRTVDPDDAYVGFQQGRIDVAPVPAGALEQARRTYGVRGDLDRGPGVVETHVPDLYFLAFRVDQPPWDDPEVRRALSRAIDRQAVVDAQGERRLDVARTIVPPAIPSAGTAFCDACVHLPTLAAAAFARADVTDLTLTVDAQGGHEVVANRIRSDLAELGVDLTVRTVPFDEYLAALDAGELTLFRFGWHAQAPHAGAMLEPVVGGTAPDAPGDGANYTGYASEIVDGLLARARVAESAADRDALWTQAEQVALDDMPVVPLFSSRQRQVVSDRIDGLAITPWGTATPERARLVTEPEVVP